MRIALLSYEYPPDTGFGGIGTYTWYQARALVRLGHDVRVVAGALTPGVTHSTHDGVEVTRCLDDEPFTGAVEGLLAEGLTWAPYRLRTAVSAFRALRDLLEVEDYDIVEAPECGADGLFVSTMLPVRTCIRFHSPARLIMEGYGRDPGDVEVTSFLEQVAVAEADVRTTPSAFVADEVVARMGVAPPVHVVPNGIDLDVFDADEGIDVAERFGLPGAASDAVTVLVSSRLERRKGAHLLPELASQLLRRHPRAHLVVAGLDRGGWMEDHIAPAVEADGNGDRLHHLGHRSQPEVRALVKHADVSLLMSTWDNAPYSALEVMAAGRPLVASDVGGLPEMVDHERTGLLARPGDAGAHVEAVSRLIEDADLREALGAAARRTVEDRYTDTVMAERTVERWRATIDQEA